MVWIFDRVLVNRSAYLLEKWSQGVYKINSGGLIDCAKLRRVSKHTITMVALNSATKPVLFTNITYPAMFVYLLLSLFNPKLVRNRLDRFRSNWHKPVFSPARFTTLILAKTLYLSRFLSFLLKPWGSGYCQKSGFKMNYCTSLQYFAMISYQEFPWERWESDQLHFAWTASESKRMVLTSFISNDDTQPQPLERF